MREYMCLHNCSTNEHFYINKYFSIILWVQITPIRSFYFFLLKKCKALNSFKVIVLNTKAYKPKLFISIFIFFCKNIYFLKNSNVSQP